MRGSASRYSIALFPAVQFVFHCSIADPPPHITQDVRGRVLYETSATPPRPGMVPGLSSGARNGPHNLSSGNGNHNLSSGSVSSLGSFEGSPTRRGEASTSLSPSEKVRNSSHALNGPHNLSSGSVFPPGHSEGSPTRRGEASTSLSPSEKVCT